MKHVFNLTVLFIAAFCVSVSCTIILTSCNTSRKISKNKNEVKSLLEEGYTPEQIKEINRLTEKDTMIDKLMSEKILFLFAIASIIFVGAGAFCIYTQQMRAAFACFLAAPAVIALPVTIVILFKALTFLLYVFCGLILIGIVLIGWWLSRKSSMHKSALAEVVGTVEDMKSAHPVEWGDYKEQVVHTEATVAEVKKVKKKS